MVRGKGDQVCRQLAIALSLLMGAWAFIVFAVTPTSPISFWDGGISLGFLGVYWLQRSGQGGWARIFLLLLVNATLTLFLGLFGEAAGTQYCFLPATALPFALFEIGERKALAFGVLLPFSLFLLLVGAGMRIPSHFAVLPAHSFIFWLTVISAFLMSFVSIYSFSKVNVKAEAELRKSEKKYAQIVELAHEGIWVIESDGRTSYVNPSLERMVGFESQSMIGRSVLEFVDTESQEALRTLLLEGRGSDAWQLEILLRHRDGAIIPVLVSARTAQLLPEARKTTVALVLDLSGIKAKEKTIEAQRAQMLSSFKLSALGEMAAGIAHEVNNPLSTLGVLAGSIRRLAGNHDLTPLKLVDLATRMEATVQRIATIIEGLRMFSKDDSREPFKQVELRKVIEDTLAFCRERFRVHGVDLEVADIPQAWIECRPVQISQVLLNLLNNAFDAVADSDSKRIALGFSDETDRLMISVTDSGRGMLPSAASKLFEPFFTTKPFGQGTGLGLSVSKGIIDAHRGEIRYDSLEGGTRFSIQLLKQLNPAT